MFNNVAFEVVIGLVLIYLLYSLLVSIVGEMIATWIGLRSRILRLAIEKMLNDAYYKEDGKLKYTGVWSWHFISRYFLKEFKEFKYSFAGKFYKQPSIKYLSSKASEKSTFFSQTKPSYFTADNFADTLISLLGAKGAGATHVDRIAFCLRFNTHHIQPETLKNISRIFNDSGNDINLFKEKLKAWFNETNDRCTGWYKRKLGLILFWLGFIIAAAFNVNSIQIAKLLAKDPDARNQLVNMGVELAKDSARYGDFVIANGDTVHSKAIIDSGYAHISKDISEANLVLGLGWNFNQLRKDDVYEISKKCDSSKYEDVLGYRRSLDSLEGGDKNRMSIDDARVAATMKKSELYKTRKKILFQQKLLADTLLTKSFPDTVKIIKDSIGKNQKKYVFDTTDFVILMDTLNYIKSSEDNLINKINECTGNRFSDIISVNYDSAGSMVIIKGKRIYSTGEKITYVFAQLFKGSSILGFIITALMLSLGAPFWFDLLKKLVSLRGAGVKPEEKKEEKKAITSNEVKEKLAGSNIDMDPVEHALSRYRNALESIPGVIAVNYDYIIFENKKTPCIEVVVKNSCNKNLIPAFYEIDLEIRKYKVPILVKDGDYAKLHLSIHPAESKLGAQNKFNQNTDNGWGSITGTVFNSRSKKMTLLSCAHVFCGNNSNNTLNGERQIINIDNEVIGQLAFNIQSNSLDVAYADTTEEIAQKYIPIKKYSELTKKDGEMETKIIMNGFISGVQEGIILNYRTHYPFNINGETVIMVNLIKLTKRVQETHVTISQEGDSGALIFKKNGEMPVGMIIGGTDEYSFAISLKEIFDSLFIEPVK